MERERSGRLLGIVAICIAIAGLSVGFAAISRTLTFTGTATVEGQSWNVHFDTDSLSTATLVGGASVPNTDTIAVTNYEVSGYDITLPAPGAQVSYTVTVMNEGSLTAIVDTAGLTRLDTESMTGSGVSQVADEALVEDEIEISLTYANTTTTAQTESVITEGTPVADGQKLLPGQSIVLRLTIGYDTDLGSENLPASDVVITNFGYNLVYKQFIPTP